MYFCASVIDNSCAAWIEFAQLPEGAGLMIGGAMLSVCITAWSIRYVANFLINKR